MIYYSQMCLFKKFWIAKIKIKSKIFFCLYWIKIHHKYWNMSLTVSTLIINNESINIYKVYIFSNNHCNKCTAW